MTVAYFILQASTPELLARTVDECMQRYEAQALGGVAFHGNTAYQAMMAPVSMHGLIGSAARCSNDQCSLREKCRLWIHRDDPWRHEPPRWRYGGPNCDFKDLLP